MVVEYLYGLTWLTPLVFTIGIATITSLISQVSFALLTNKEFMKSSREDLKNMQKELVNMKPEDSNYQAKQTKLLELNTKVMKHSMKPSLVTMIPFLAIFAYARSVIPMDQPLINLPFNLPIIGMSLEFLGVYMIISLILSMVLRKVFGR